MPGMTTPRVGIGLLVYNGEQHLPEAIDSLLTQTMGDFVLDISDNASTDRTEEICRSYVAADPRVRYVRHDKNRGPTWSSNFVAQASPDTEFYKWCAHDDIYDPTYLERCVEELDEQPEIVACHCRSRFINDRGDELMRSFRLQTFTDLRPWVRLNQILVMPHDHSHGFAVIRRSTLARIRPFQPVFKSDAILMSELALQGPLGEVPEHLFANRMHPSRATAVISKGRTPLVWAEWFRGSTRFPLWHTLAALHRSVASAPLEPVARARCYAVLAAWMRTEWKNLGWDLAADGPRVVRERIGAGRRRAPGR